MKGSLLDHLVMDNDILKQFKNLTAKDEKLFYYAFGKLQSRAIAIKREIQKNKFANGNKLGFDTSNIDVDIDEIGVVSELEVNVSYDEIKILNGIERVDKRNFKTINEKLLKDAWCIWIEEGNNYTGTALYEKIVFNNDKRRIEVLFTESAAKLLTIIDDKVTKGEDGKCLGGFAKISIKNICPLKKTYDLKFYLYALTILRGNKGYITIGMDVLRGMLGPDAKIEDKMFYQRYIKNPAKAINDLKLDIKIDTERKGDNVVINVVKRKGR